MQVIATVMSYDPASDTDVLSMCATAAAFAVSDIPMTDPIAGVRIVRLDGEWLINPSLEQQAAADINLVVAGSRAGISMVEGAANEAPEEAMMEAMELLLLKSKRSSTELKSCKQKSTQPSLKSMHLLISMKK